MKPILCNYYVTLRCNSKCEFCDIWQKEGSCDEQNISQVQNNLEDLKKLGVKLIDFTGGEPLLFKKLPEALKIAKEIGFYTTVTTNCILYPKYAEDLSGVVDYLQFSFESVVEEKHNKTVGVDSYKKVIESIKIAKSLNQNVSLNFTLSDSNYRELESMIAFAQENKCILIVNPCFEYFGNEAVSAEIITEAEKYFNEPYVVMDLSNHKLIKNGGNDTESPVCRAISSTVVISPDNNLMLPCYHQSIKKIKIENNLFDIYRSEEVSELKKMEGRFEFCQNCKIYCYMRSSFYRNVFSSYFWLSLKTGINYLRERGRKQ